MRRYSWSNISTIYEQSLYLKVRMMWLVSLWPLEPVTMIYIINRNLSFESVKNLSDCTCSSNVWNKIFIELSSFRRNNINGKISLLHLSCSYFTASLISSCSNINFMCKSLNPKTWKSFHFGRLILDWLSVCLVRDLFFQVYVVYLGANRLQTAHLASSHQLHLLSKVFTRFLYHFLPSL